VTLLTCGGLLMQTGCFFRRKGPADAPTRPAPARIALLPVNVPHESPDLRWISFAATAMMAEIALASPDLEAVPLWESVPVALQSLENSRTVTMDLAELVATRLTARWATQADLVVANKTIRLRIDFIPAQSNMIPFRYEKLTTTEALDGHFREAFEQFLRYLTTDPQPRRQGPGIGAGSIRDLGVALDEEYGWYVPAKPGDAAKLVENLSRTAPGLARVLFNPSLYPVLGTIKPPLP
jgi:hypothetical protein